MDITLWRANNPAAIGLWLCARHRRKPVDLSAALTGASRISMGDTRGIHIAARLFEHDAADTVKIHQRMQAFGSIAGDLMEMQPVIFCLCCLQAQLMLTRLGLRQIERAGLEHAAALPGLCLQRLVEIHRVVLDTGDVGVVMQAVYVGCGMPG